MQKITYVTGNPVKARMIGKHLDWPFDVAELDLIEIQSLDVVDVAEHKAREAFSLLRRPVFVDDFSIVFNALGKLPGPLIKFFTQQMKVQGLCKLLHGQGDRSAVVKSAIAYADEYGVVNFCAELKGSIAYAPRGDRSFGSASIFMPEGSVLTWSQMTEDEAETVLRKPALHEFRAFLVERLKRPTPQR